MKVSELEKKAKEFQEMAHQLVESQKRADEAAEMAWDAAGEGSSFIKMINGFRKAIKKLTGEDDGYQREPESVKNESKSSGSGD